MTTNEPIVQKPLRLWPGVVLAALLLILRFGAPLVAADGMLIAVLGAVACGALIGVWWLLFSRAPWAERLGVLLFMAVAMFATMYVVHPSIRGGLMGRMLPLFLGIPGFAVALVAALVITRRASANTRRAAIAGAILLACAGFAMLRTDGIRGASAQIAWRWTPTAEERLLASTAGEPLPLAPVSVPAAPDATPANAATEPAVAPAAAPKTAAGAAKATNDTPPPAPVPAGAKLPVRWPGFRGPDRDSIIHGVKLDTDWTKSPPVELWRRPIGPGWSSFAVAGDFIYTQEQRGEDELVAAYHFSTGKPIWVHKDPVRFYESNGGAGPRATPTLANGRVYTFGATGILNALDAMTGAVVWSRNPSIDNKVKMPGWGFTSSPLVVDNVVIVAISGALAGYDAATGAPRWFRKSGGGSYSSPHLATIDGVPQVILMAGPGATSVAPADGKVLWEHAWAGIPIVQPAHISDGDFLITTADAMGALGMRRVAVAHGGAGWSAQERWTTKGLKPYFNDFVIHKGHAYGFDGSILACISLDDGARKWKGGRFGNGQLVLLAEQDVLLVLSEEGELALVSATPDQFTELATFKAIEGKTWNHPVLVGDVLLVRNGEEMAAFRLPVAGR